MKDQEKYEVVNQGQSLEASQNLERDSVLLSPHAYKTIFKKTFGSQKNEPKKRGIVKIRVNDITIHRMYQGCTDLTKLQVFLHPMDYYRIKSVLKSGINITQGCRFLFWWNNPKHEVRVAVKLGFLSVLLGLLSIVLTFIN